MENAILMLNDDCLLYIFSFLNIKDQINLSYVCPQFNDITEMIFRKKYKTIDLGRLEGCTEVQAKSFFNKVGENVTTVTSSSNHNVTEYCLGLLVYFCPNIECLNLKATNLNTETYDKLKSIFTNLKSLTLSTCGIDDNHCYALKNCSKLQYLDVSNNENITGKYLDTLPNLKTLNLSICYNIRQTPFTALCKVSKLTELNINEGPRLRQELVDVLLETQTDLEILRISNSFWADIPVSIVRLPNLKHLDISYRGTVSDGLFSELVKYKSKSLKVLGVFGLALNQSQQEYIFSLTGLEELSIVVDQQFLTELAIRNPNLRKLSCLRRSQLSDEAVISYIVESKELEFIDLSVNRFQLSFQFISNLVDALKCMNRTKPITLCLGITSLYGYYITDIASKLAENQHLLNVL